MHGAACVTPRTKHTNLSLALCLPTLKVQVGCMLAHILAAVRDSKESKDGLFGATSHAAELVVFRALFCLVLTAVHASNAKVLNGHPCLSRTGRDSKMSTPRHPSRSP